MNDDIRRLCDAAKGAKIDGQRMRFSDEYAEVIVRAVLKELREPSAAMKQASCVPVHDPWRRMIDCITGK